MCEEEDAVEMLNMMLCVRREKHDDEWQSGREMRVVSDSSIWGMVGLGGGIMEGCHFDLSDESDEDDKEGRSVVIRNLPPGYNVDRDYSLSSMIEDQGVWLDIKEIRPVRVEGDIVCVFLPAVKVVTKTKQAAIKLEEKVNEMKFKGRSLIAKRIQK